MEQTLQPHHQSLNVFQKVKKNLNLLKIILIHFYIGLSSWREAVQRSVTSSQLSMALYTLEQCVAWDKSIMKAVC